MYIPIHLYKHNEEAYRAASAMLEEGNLKIPKSYVTPTGLTLGSWKVSG